MRLVHFVGSQETVRLVKVTRFGRVVQDGQKPNREVGSALGCRIFRHIPSRVTRAGAIHPKKGPRRSKIEHDAVLKYSEN